MLKTAVRLCASGLLTIAALAQPALPDPATIVDRLQKQMAPLAEAWLDSSDPRFQAWGAYAVLRDRHTAAIPMLLAKVAAFSVLDTLATQAEVDQHDAMVAILDALIQLGAQVPLADAQRIYPAFPAASMILLSRSQEDTAAALLAIFNSERRWPAAWLAAGDLLLERRASGFAAAVIAGMTVHAQLTVTEPGVGGGFGGASLCCGLGSTPPTKAGWPPVGMYAFGDCGVRLQPGDTVLAGGTDPAYYSRQVNDGYKTTQASGCCTPDQDLVRQHFITALVSNPSGQPPVRAHVSHTIIWHGVEAYRGEVAALIARQQHLFAEMARRLRDLGLLSVDEANLRPALQVRVWDQRQSHQAPLPAIPAQPGNITVEPLALN